MVNKISQKALLTEYIAYDNVYLGKSPYGGSVMFTRALNTRFVIITQMKVGEDYFSVAVGQKNHLYIETPFRLVDVRNEFDKEDAMFTKKIIVSKLEGGFEGTIRLRDGKVFAASLGLLVGTQYLSRFGDNHHRTFQYSPPLFSFFEQIVHKQDFAQYEAIVGKKERLSVAQQVQKVFFEASVAAFAQRKKFLAGKSA